MASKKALNELSGLSGKGKEQTSVFKKNEPSWKADFDKLDKTYQSYQTKKKEKEEKINSRLQSPYMKYDLDSMRKEVDALTDFRNKSNLKSGYLYTDENGNVQSESEKLKGTGYNTIKEFEDALSKKSAAVNRIDREQTVTKLELNALRDRTYDYYSEAGSRFNFNFKATLMHAF